MPREQDLGRLAGEESQGGKAADGIAGEKRGQRTPQRERGTWREAPPPALRTYHEAGTGQPDDRQQAPADAANAVNALGDARALYRDGEQRRPAQRGGDRDDVLAGRCSHQGTGFGTRLARLDGPEYLGET